MTSNYTKARKTPLAMCTSSTIKGKMVPEEVFTVKVKAGATINLTVTAFETTVGNNALIDARWGGSCSVSGGAGANKIACLQSTKTPSAAWKNDQSSEQTVWFTLEPAAGTSTTNKFITGHYTLNWDMYTDGCTSAVELKGSGEKSGALLASHTPPKWATGFNTLCSVANKTDMRDVIYYADVPAYNSIKLELTSSSKLIMEGRLQGDSSSNKGTCPGASTQFCGNVNNGKATSAWYNGNSATTRMYIMIEEPSASTKIKSFTLKYAMSNTSLECEEIALPNTCADQKCSLHNKWQSVTDSVGTDNFLGTSCCPKDSDCGGDRVMMFKVPFGAKLSAKVTPKAWKAKYELRTDGSCNGRSGMSPGVNAASSCYTTKKGAAGNVMTTTGKPVKGEQPWSIGRSCAYCNHGGSSSWKYGVKTAMDCQKIAQGTGANGGTLYFTYLPNKKTCKVTIGGSAAQQLKCTSFGSYGRSCDGNVHVAPAPSAPPPPPPPTPAPTPYKGSFTVNLGTGRYGVAAATTTFLKLTVAKQNLGKSYTDAMIAACKEYNMQPVCDHPSYCRNDNTNSLYLGQANHIGYPPHRRINSWFPSGWSSISKKWNGLCVYSARANGNYALCNIPINTHAWRTPQQYNPGFMCGTRQKAKAQLGATKIPTTLLFKSPGSTTTYQNQWTGWYKAGTTTTGNGKYQAYDTTPLNALLFQDNAGNKVQYTLDSSYAGKTLLTIVSECMGMERTQSSSEQPWRVGHCTIAPGVTQSAGMNTNQKMFKDGMGALRIGVGDSASKSSDTKDWALFMPMKGNGRGDYSGARTWAFGSEYRTNTGYNGMVWIYGNAVTKSSYYTVFNGVGSLATHKNTWAGWYSSAASYNAKATANSNNAAAGKDSSYNTQNIDTLKLEDGRGYYVEYQLFSRYMGKPLLEIVRGCLGNDRTQNSGESKWRNGHCSIGVRKASRGIEGYANLRIGVGDSGRGSNDQADWALFMPLAGNGRGDYSGAKIWAMGSEYRTNTGYNGKVYIRAHPTMGPVPPPPFQPVFLTVEGVGWQDTGDFTVDWKMELPSLETGCDTSLKSLNIISVSKGGLCVPTRHVRDCIGGAGSKYKSAVAGKCSYYMGGSTNLVAAQKLCDNEKMRPGNQRGSAYKCLTVYKMAGRYYWCRGTPAQQAVTKLPAQKYDTGRCSASLVKFKGQNYCPPIPGCPSHGLDATSPSTAFMKDLGAGRYGVPANRYIFYKSYGWTKGAGQGRGGYYADVMTNECTKHSMKPVCDHPSYCRNNGDAIYLGQYSHIAYKPYRRIARNHPRRPQEAEQHLQAVDPQDEHHPLNFVDDNNNYYGMWQPEFPPHSCLLLA